MTIKTSPITLVVILGLLVWLLVDPIERFFPSTRSCPATSHRKR